LLFNYSTNLCFVLIECQIQSKNINLTKFFTKNKLNLINHNLNFNINFITDKIQNKFEQFSLFSSNEFALLDVFQAKRTNSLIGQVYK
jgi:hypothetical protein